jgi:hypothetical protein
LTHILSPIFAASLLSLGFMAAPAAQAAPINWEGLKSSFTYVPFAGESLDRIIAKTMPNSDLKTEVLAEAFKALNPQQFSKDASSVAKSNTALKIPNQNQIANLVEAQLGDKPADFAATQKNAKAQDTKAQEAKDGKPQPKGLLAGTTMATSKVNPKTEGWVRFPSRMMALSKTVEGWVRFPNPGTVSPVAAEWVRYPSHANQALDITASSGNTTASRVDQSNWVRYQTAKADVKLGASND